MARDDDDADVDLGISLETVATIVDHARALAGKEETDPAQEDEDQNSQAALLQLTPDDATSEAVIGLIDELPADEQAALIALAWIGRGDFGPDDWEEAQRLAAERNENGGAGAYLMDMDLIGDLLAEGVAAFGLSIENVER